MGRLEQSLEICLLGLPGKTNVGIYVYVAMIGLCCPRTCTDDTGGLMQPQIGVKYRSPFIQLLPKK
jgi:hypothetical protein